MHDDVSQTMLLDDNLIPCFCVLLLLQDLVQHKHLILLAHKKAVELAQVNERFKFNPYYSSNVIFVVTTTSKFRLRARFEVSNSNCLVSYYTTNMRV